MANSVDPDQTAPRSVDPDQTAPMSSLFWVHAVCFYTLFVSILGNHLQQTTSADDIFRCIFLETVTHM